MNRMTIFGSSLCVLALALTLSSTAHAVPYASGVTESAGTVTFFLNEDADDVTVNRTGDTALSLGSLTKGSHTFPVGAASAYDIAVSNTAAVGWTQISDDSNIQSQFFSPRGVAINQNPSSPHFGNIYVSERIGGQVTASGGTRNTLSGIFVMGADQSDIIGQVDDGAVGGNGALWDANSNTPWKISVAPDDSIYITGFSDGASNVWRAPSDLDESSNWPKMLADDNPAGGGLFDNHGNSLAVYVEGTGASTVMYTMDEDFPTVGDILRYDVGTATDYAALPTKQVEDLDSDLILNSLVDFVRDEDGSWWVAQNRFTDTQAVPSLTHWADGATDASYASGRSDGLQDADFDEDSLVAGVDFLTWQRGYPNIYDGGNGPDPIAPHVTGDADFDGDINEDDLAIWVSQFGTSLDTLNLDFANGSIDIHNDKDLLIMGTNSSGSDVYILDISDPDNPALVSTIPSAGTNRDVAFDIAGNAYLVNSSTENLRIWSPGGSTLATTGSGGTFTLGTPGPLLAAITTPEPSSLIIFVTGVACCLHSRRRRSS